MACKCKQQELAPTNYRVIYQNYCSALLSDDFLSSPAFRHSQFGEKKEESHNLLSINSTVESLFIKFEINKQVFAVYSCLLLLFSVIEKKSIPFIKRVEFFLPPCLPCRSFTRYRIIDKSSRAYFACKLKHKNDGAIQFLLCSEWCESLSHPQPLIPVCRFILRS